MTGAPCLHRLDGLHFHFLKMNMPETKIPVSAMIGINASGEFPPPPPADIDAPIANGTKIAADMATMTTTIKMKKAMRPPRP